MRAAYHAAKRGQARQAGQGRKGRLRLQRPARFGRCTVGRLYLIFRAFPRGARLRLGCPGAIERRFGAVQFRLRAALFGLLARVPFARFALGAARRRRVRPVGVTASANATAVKKADTTCTFSCVVSGRGRTRSSGFSTARSAAFSRT